MFDDRFLQSFVKTSAVPIQDLSWLDIDEDEYAANERLPNNEKSLNIKDQLRVLWDHHVDIDRGPGRFNLIPNVEKLPEGTELTKKSSEDIANLTKKVKIAMMQGVTGSALVVFIRSKFARDTIEQSKTALEKLALEQGLLGFVYTDPDLLKCQKISKFDKSSQLAEFVLQRSKCLDCQFASENLCLKFELPITEEIDYTEALVARLKKKLEARGFSYEDDAVLEPKQRLQLIFLSHSTPTTKSFNHFTLLRKEKISVTEDDLEQFLSLGTLKAQANAKQLAIEKIGKAKFQVLAFLRRSLIAGQHLTDIVPVLKQKFARDTLKLAQKEITALVRVSGFFGNLYATLDTFHKCSDLSEHLKRSGSLVRYLQKSGKCPSCTCNQEGKCLELGLALVDSPEDININEELFNSYLTELINRGRISPTAENLLDSEDCTESLKNLLKSKSLQQPLRGGHIVQEHILGQESSSLVVAQTAQKRQKFLLANALQALEKGVSLKAIQAKLKTLLPSNTSSYILESALKEAATLNTKSFKYCQKLGGEGLTLNKEARLLSKDSCTDCIFNSKVHCTKIGNRFENREFEIEKGVQADTTAAEHKEFYAGSKISIPMSAKRTLLEGEIEGLNEFTIG